jgi:hypothetical protein
MDDLFATIKRICPEAELFDDGEFFRVHVSKENVHHIDGLLRNNLPVALVAQQEGTVGPGGIFPKAFWAPQPKNS